MNAINVSFFFGGGGGAKGHSSEKYVHKTKCKEKLISIEGFKNLRPLDSQNEYGIMNVKY